jgi:hypothetical protein
LVYKNGLLGIKFNEGLISRIKEIPQKLSHAKKDVSFYMEPSVKMFNPNKKPTLSSSLADFRPKTSANLFAKTNQENEKYGTNIPQLYSEENLRETYANEKEFNPNKFLNDLKLKVPIQRKTLSQLNVNKRALDFIYFMRNDLLAKMKGLDLTNMRKLKVASIVDFFIRQNIDGLEKEKIEEIMKIYCGLNESIDYRDFIDKLSADIKDLLEYNKFQVRDKVLRNSVSFKENRLLASTPNKFIENKDMTKTELAEYKKDIQILKHVLPQILIKNRLKNEQTITYRELSMFMKEFSIKFPHDKFVKILRYLEIDPDKFSLTFLNSRINGKF